MRYGWRCVWMGVVLVWPFWAAAKSVEVSDGGKAWGQEEVKKMRPARKADAMNQYGGAARNKVARPGFFRVVKKSKKWWVVDPEGCLFYIKGVNSVGPKPVGVVDARGAKAWAKSTVALLKGAGFNMVGRWSDQEVINADNEKMPWCSTLSFMKTYSKHRPSKNGAPGFVNETIPVFDPEWPAFCEDYAHEHAHDLRRDPWLFGHFSDNELPFRPDALEKYLALPSGDTGNRAVRKWMREHKVRSGDVNESRYQMAFVEEVARRYFGAVAAALKKADPNHLYIGSRLHGRCINEGVLRGAHACDVISVNYYHRWLPEEDRIEAWEEWSGRPFFVSEFYAMKVPNKKTEAQGAGFRVLNHEDAGLFYQTYTVSLLKDIPSCVGWHWFKYADEFDEARKGVVDRQGRPHTELLDAMKSVNDQAYALRGLRR